MKRLPPASRTAVLVAVVIAGFMLLPAAPVRASNLPAGNSGTTYARFYGYVGNTFDPQSQLALSATTVLRAASQLSTAAGGPGNLALVSVVDETQGQVVSPKLYATIEGYVAELHKYAGTLYGRIDLYQFNMTSNPSIYQELGKYVGTLGLNGAWFDHAVLYYEAIGQTKFNAMMQELISLYPHAHFILNHCSAATIITPLAGTTWASNTLVSPTVNPSSYDKVSLKLISQFNAVWPGAVLLHLDAYAKDPSEPMGIFADQTSATEITAASYLVSTGFANGYSFLYPVLGGWTSASSMYGGKLYNGLSQGTFSRGTLPGFLKLIQTHP